MSKKVSDIFNGYKKEILINWNKSRDNIITVGKLLSEAKDSVNALKKESWEELVKELPFTKRTADRLIKIAKCEWIISGDYNESLPVSWGTLHEISTLTKEQFEKGVKNNNIKPDCTRNDIVKFKDSCEEVDVSTIIDSLSNPEASGAVTLEQDTNQEKETRKLSLGNVFIKGDSFSSDEIKELQSKLASFITGLQEEGTEVRIDFSSYEGKVEKQMKKTEEDKLKVAVKEGYSKLTEATMDAVQNDVSLNDEYLTSPEKKMKFKNDFFKVNEFSFLATQFIIKFGLRKFDGVVKNTKLPEDYLQGIRSTVPVAA